MGKKINRCRHWTDLNKYGCSLCASAPARIDELIKFKKWLIKHDEPANDDGWNRAVRFIASEIDRRCAAL
jgi:hypothetical protein